MTLPYTTPAGTVFGFELEERSDGWRVYIDRQPGYGSRPSDGHSTHRYGIGGRPFICWDRPIPSLADAIFIAAQWALRTERYIVTGETF